MKNINIAAVIVVAAVSLTAGCKKGTDWDPQFNVPEGIYISGDATKFSVETTYGAFPSLMMLGYMEFPPGWTRRALSSCPW